MGELIITQVFRDNEERGNFVFFLKLLCIIPGPPVGVHRRKKAPSTLAWLAVSWANCRLSCRALSAAKAQPSAQLSDPSDWVPRLPLKCDWHLVPAPEEEYPCPIV